MSSGRTEVVQKLLEAKAPVDAQQDDGPGPLLFFGDRLANCVRSQRVSVCDDLFIHIQRDKSLPHGLPISINDLGRYFPSRAWLGPMAFLWTAVNQISLQGSYSLLHAFLLGDGT